MSLSTVPASTLSFKSSPPDTQDNQPPHVSVPLFLALLHGLGKQNGGIDPATKFKKPLVGINFCQLCQQVVLPEATSKGHCASVASWGHAELNPIAYASFVALLDPGCKSPVVRLCHGSGLWSRL